MKASKSIGFVPLNSGATQEQALVASINYAIRFVQKHEACYFIKPSLKTLKRVTDGIRLIRHAFWLFDDIVSKDDTDSLRVELKWLLSELAWVENAIQLKTYTSKRHAYYKKINSAPELTQVINDLKELQPSIEDVQELFYSKRYNRLLLQLTTWLIENSGVNHGAKRSFKPQKNRLLKSLSVYLPKIGTICTSLFLSSKCLRTKTIYHLEPVLKIHY